MRKNSLAIIVLFLFSISLSAHTSNSVAIQHQNNENPVETYAVLFDQFPYDDNGTTVCSAIELKSTLLNLGWNEENISLFLGDENITKTIFLEQLNYLEQVVDENDLVFIYVMAHGHTYCRDVLEFNTWFQTEFFQINTKNKIYLMDSCYAGEFVRNFYGTCFAMGSVGEYEIAIGVFPGENGTWVLSEPPFAGGISSHFWAKSLTNIDADTSLDGVVSLQEMYEHSLPAIRECYNETFELYPDLADYVDNVAGYTENYPYPRVVNNLHYEITLNATEFILNNEKYILEDDLEGPKINSQEIMYFAEEDSFVDITFQISDQSNFDYYCYVDEVLVDWDSHAATGEELWNYTYELAVQSNNNYNVSLAAVDEWTNRNVNFTLVKYNGNTDTAPFEFTVSVLVFLLFQLVILRFKTRKRKD